MRRNIALPRGWNRRVKSAILHIQAISHYVFAALQGWAAQNRCLKVRLQAEVDRLKQELGLLQEELRIKDNRMSRVLPHRRPYYGPLERMSILELRATRGWSAQQTAERFLITPATVASWMARIDEDGPSALLRIPQPVNKFPDLVRYIVQRLRLLCPRLGKVKIAEILCRAGLHLAPTSVRRILREKPVFPEPMEEVATVGSVVKATRPNHVWHIDMTAVPTSLGFWTPWMPFAAPQEWPFCWWLVVVIDHFSRRVQGWMVFERKPNSRTLRAFLGRSSRKIGRVPRHLISDKERQFDCDGFRNWCRRRGIRPRYGAAGKHGSIAIIERFILTLKNECTRRILVPFRRDRLQQELAVFIRWYNGQRPHSTLGIRTPDEAYRGASPACELPRLELRSRWPPGSRCASPQVPVDPDTPAHVRLEVSFFGGRRHLPLVSLRRAA